MRHVYHPDALTEYADAALYYEERVPGLGADFTSEIDAAIECIVCVFGICSTWPRNRSETRR